MLIVDFDPVALDLGFLQLRWYSLAYIVGIVCARLWVTRFIIKSPSPACSVKDIDDFLFFAVIGIVIGGRLGFVLFWEPEYYFRAPQDIIKIWQGGMAFHGGLLGVIMATIIFCQKRGISLYRFGDYLAISAPIGLFLGRLANFINGELWGRVTDVPWGVIYPHIDNQTRHPSPLYEALLEGALLFIIVNIIYYFSMKKNYHGYTMASFLVLYGIFRIIAEIFREEAFDSLFNLLTTGQLLSLPMILAGLYIAYMSYKQHQQ